jgi:hypothetical protein
MSGTFSEIHDYDYDDDKRKAKSIIEIIEDLTNEELDFLSSRLEDRRIERQEQDRLRYEEAFCCPACKQEVGRKDRKQQKCRNCGAKLEYV